MVCTLVISDYLLQGSSASVLPLGDATQSSGESRQFSIEIHSEETFAGFDDKSPSAVATRVVQRRRSVLEKLRDM
jgi:hypothetical protein